MPEPPPPDGRDAVVHVLRGNPDDTELAALVAVLLLARTPVVVPAPRSPWADPAFGPDAPLWPGESAWRLSGLPY